MYYVLKFVFVFYFSKEYNLLCAFFLLCYLLFLKGKPVRIWTIPQNNSFLYIKNSKIGRNIWWLLSPSKTIWQHIFPSVTQTIMSKKIIWVFLSNGIIAFLHLYNIFFFLIHTIRYNMLLFINDSLMTIWLFVSHKLK